MMSSKIFRFIVPRSIKDFYNHIYYKIFYRGLNTNIAFGVSLDKNNMPKIGRYVEFYHNNRMRGDIEIGDHTYFNINVSIESFFNTPKIKIGKFCSFASGSSIVVNRHRINHLTSFPIKKITNIDSDEEEYHKGGVTIGNDVWVGKNAIILGGVTIGDGAVIGAGSVVTKDVEPYSIVVGSPAVHKMYRFSKDIIDIISKEKWWVWPDEKIARNKDIFERDISKMSPKDVKNLFKNAK